MDDNKFEKIRIQPDPSARVKELESEPACSGEEVPIYEIPTEKISSADAPAAASRSKILRNRLITLCKPITDRPRSFFGGFVIVVSILLLYFFSQPEFIERISAFFSSQF